jgi:hypothetical protein
LRSPRKRQPSKRRLTPIVPTHETAFSPVAKKAAKGNIRQPQIFYVRENSRLLHRPGVHAVQVPPYSVADCIHPPVQSGVHLQQ